MQKPTLNYSRRLPFVIRVPDFDITPLAAQVPTDAPGENVSRGAPRRRPQPRRGHVCGRRAAVTHALRGARSNDPTRRASCGEGRRRNGLSISLDTANLSVPLFLAFELSRCFCFMLRGGGYGGGAGDFCGSGGAWEMSFLKRFVLALSC